MKKIPFIFFLILLTSCTSYDKALIYQSNYTVGQNKLLRFDGYYSDTLHVDATNSDIKYLDHHIRPTFFYTDGTCVLGSNFSNSDTLSAYLKRGWNNIGFWANYEINGDTIRIEYFSRDGGTGNMDRYIITGFIQNNKIYFPVQTIRNDLSLKIPYYSYFNKFDFKPDSTKNWIRTNKFYKKKKQ